MLRTLLALALASLVLPAPAALAKEESKIQIRLTSGSNSGPGNGVGQGGVRGDVRTHLQGSKAVLQLRVRGLAPDAEYALICLDDEDALESAELVRFETGSSGSANVTQNLAKADDPEAPADPRGKFLVLIDGAGDPVLSGWLYGVPEDDGPKTKVKELTQLAPDEESDPSGRVDASYRMLPNGHGRLGVATRGIPQGDYELWVDGVLVASFSPNPGGNARLDFRTRTSKGKGPKKVKPHNQKMQLDFDPRRKLIEVQRDDGTPMFAGPMIAQIEGLNACAGASAESALVDGGARFDPTPDEPGELLLDIAVDAGLAVEVFEAGADPGADTPVLAGAIP